MRRRRLLFSDPKFPTAWVCLPAPRPYGVVVIIAGTDCTCPASLLFPLVLFQLGFSGIPENDEKLRIHHRRSDPAGPPFFFPSLVRVEHLLLARTRSDFGATLLGGSI